MAINLHFTSGAASNLATDGSSLSDMSSLPLSEFHKWYTEISSIHQDLFRPPIEVLPPSGYDFRIVTDLLAKAPYW
jgi:hypothetical protein